MFTTRYDLLRPLLSIVLIVAINLLAVSAIAQTTDEDLDIGWIHRLPELDYVPNSPQPDVDGWPTAGQIVTWQAVVKNWFATDQTDVEYEWLLDGVPIGSGVATLTAGEHTAIDLDWEWTFDRHELTIIIDPLDEIAEFSESNNELMVYTNAISVGFWVEETIYDYFHEFQHELGIGSNSWEDWGQRHVARWNQMFADAIYPDSPDGVLDRIRCDKVVLVPDGALPLAWGYYPTNHPDTSDKTVDLMWGFPASLLNGTRYTDHTTIDDFNEFYFEGSLMHELGHARYLVDTYGFDTWGGQVFIEEDGVPIEGTDYMPHVNTGGAVFLSEYVGLMHTTYTFVDEYSTAAMNRIAGHRALAGNYNAPYNLGSFMQNLADENVLTVTDSSGEPLAGASVQVYQATGQPGVWYGKHFDNIPDLDLFADADGQVYLGRCPFSDTGAITHYYELCNSVIIVRLEYDGTVGYEFMHAGLFNFEYWRGNTTEAHFTLELELSTGVDIAPQPLVSLGNYPNPFNPGTEIRYELGREMQVKLMVYSLDGRLVTVLREDLQPAGTHVVRWNGRDSDGRSLASGTYLCAVAGDGVVQTHKMVLVR